MARFIDPDAGDNPYADQILAEKFKYMTLKGLIPLDSQVMVPFEQKAYLYVLCPFHLASALTCEINRYENIIAMWHDDTCENNTVEDFYVTYVTYSKANENKPNRKMKGMPLSHLHSKSDMELIQDWLSKDMIDEICNNSYVVLNVTSPSFSTDPLYIFDIINTALNSIEIFKGFMTILESDDYQQAINYYHTNQGSIELDMEIDDTTLGLAVLKSMTTSFDYKVKMLKFLLEQDMFPDPSYEFLADVELESSLIFDPAQIEILKATIRPFLPQWYLDQRT